MKFELHTATWGQWHTDLFLTIALPTLLADKNIPSLMDGHEATYRIYTTPKWAAYLDQHPIMAKLRQILPVEYVLYRQDENYKALNHMEIWHSAAEHAKADGAVLVVIPPDTIWPNGVIANSVTAIMRPGIRCVAVPYMLTVSETTVPALLGPDRSYDSTNVIDIGPRDLMGLVVDHYHPHLMVLEPQNPHGRPPLEIMQPVGTEGFVVRCYVRELFMIDLNTVNVTELFYGDDLDNADQYYLMRDSDEGFLVGLHALLKYSYIAHANRPLEPFDIAACSLTGVNRAPFVWETGREPILFHRGNTSGPLWRKVIRKSFSFYFEAMLLREFLLVREALVQSGGATKAARLIAAVTHIIRMTRLWRPRRRVAVFVPTDACLSDSDWALWQGLCREGSEKELIGAIQALCCDNFDLPMDVEDGSEITVQYLNGRCGILRQAGGSWVLDARWKIDKMLTAGEVRHSIYLLCPTEAASS